MAGRPTKHVPTTHARIIKALKRGATHKLAAAAGGIGYSTFMDWQRDNPEFSASVVAAEAFAAERWLRMIDKAMPDDWRAAAWKLERVYPDDYGKRERMDVKHSGSVDMRLLADLRKVIVSALGESSDPLAQLRIADALAGLDEGNTHAG